LLAALYDMTDEFLTVADVAMILKLNQQTVRNWIDRGELPAIRVGRRVRIRRSDFDQLVERGRIVPPAQYEQPPAQSLWDRELAPTPVEPSGRG
jgi:excisionase family DNA binding protein